MPVILADAIHISSNGGMIQNLLYFLLVVICFLLIWWVGTWFIAKLGAPGIVRTCWDGLFILVGLFVIINFLLGLGGHPLVTW